EIAMSKHRHPIPDLLVPFGYKCGWFAVCSSDTEAVVRAFGLREPTPSTWAAGIGAAYEDKVFVTPPIHGWLLLAAWAWLRHLDYQPGRIIGPALRTLSKQLGRVQLFVTYRVPEFHLWAEACSSRLLRGYCYIGEIGETVWSQGRPTAAE